MIVQVQWWERELLHLVAQDGVEELQKLSPEEYATFVERSALMGMAEGQGYTQTTVPSKCYYEAFLGAENVVGKRKLEMGMFQWTTMTGERDSENKCFYGMMRDMFDPQMWANKWLSQTMHIMNTNAKGGIMAETDAFANVRKAEQDWADNTKIVWVKPGALAGNKVKDRTPPPLPQGLGDLMGFAISSIRDVTGVNLELLGQADREQAASLEMQRRQSAMTILATLFNSLRRYRKISGKLMLHFIQLMPNGTLVRVLENGLHKYIPLMHDENVEKYDIIIDEAPSSPNQKEAVWALINQLLQSGTPLPPEAIIKLLKYSPLPESVVKEIMDSMGLSGGEIPPEQLKQKLEQAEQALQVLEDKVHELMEEAKSSENDRSIDLLKLEIEEYKAETMRLSAQWTAGVAADKALVDAAVTPDPLEEKEHEMNMQAADHQNQQVMQQQAAALAPEPTGEQV
jgi:hypothetical protein